MSSTAVEAEATHESASRRYLVLMVVFSTTAFASAWLLFMVEPMVSKMLTPVMGGTPSVWTTALVFFQFTLLAGYVVAHVSLTRLGARRQGLFQLVLLVVAIALLPVAVPDWDPSTERPELWTLAALTVMVGLPFLALSSMSPAIQGWFARTDHPRAADPYFLYAAGNLGSLLALLAYPVLLEPRFALSDQSDLWTAGYVALFVMTAACQVLVRLRPELAAATGEIDGDAPAITNEQRLRWFVLAAVPSALLVGVTQHIATEVASIPLLWVVPLSLYLLTFIVAFGRDPKRPVDLSGRALRLLVIPLILTFFGSIPSLGLVLGLNLAVFVCGAMVAHGRLAADRPPAARLTEFYVLLSLGGVFGGLVTAIVAPLLFPAVWEYPVAIVLSVALVPDPQNPTREGPFPTRRGPTNRTLLLGVGLVALAGISVLIRSSGSQSSLTLSMVIAAAAGTAAYLLARTSRGFAAAIGGLAAAAFLLPANPTLFQDRTFFGVHRVYADQTHDDRHVLTNGTTVHGMEQPNGPDAGEPLSYYSRSGPAGHAFARFADDDEPLSVAVIGQGSGALAAYGRAGDTMTFFEVDPAVSRIADDPDLFTFMGESDAEVDVVLGDGRLSLEDSDVGYDVVVVDAFSGDAVPTHLLTREALEVYRSHLVPDGVILLHLSNRYFDLVPVANTLAADAGMAAYVSNDSVTEEEAARGKLASTWVLLADDDAAVAGLTRDPIWQRLPDDSSDRVWTDDYSNLLAYFAGFG